MSYLLGIRMTCNFELQDQFRHHRLGVLKWSRLKDDFAHIRCSINVPFPLLAEALSRFLGCQTVYPVFRLLDPILFYLQNFSNEIISLYKFCSSLKRIGIALLVLSSTLILSNILVLIDRSSISHTRYGFHHLCSKGPLRESSILA